MKGGGGQKGKGAVGVGELVRCGEWISKGVGGWGVGGGGEGINMMSGGDIGGGGNR